MALVHIIDDLRNVDAALRACTDDYDENLADRHWAIRAVIGLTPAETLADVRLKAEALRVELERTKGSDGETNGWESSGNGSARHLAESIVADLLALVE